MSSFTGQQSAAIQGTGNLLLVAGAGTGKTHTLIARALRLILDERVSVETLLMVTFTEAAAAEMRGRLRAELLKRQAAQPDDEWLAQQLALLDTAPICTLHSFCLQLVREHFSELGLDPQFTVLDETQTRPLQRAALDTLLEQHYAGSDANAVATRDLIRRLGRGADIAVRKLILKLHAFAQSLPDPAGWLDAQARRFSATEPTEWRTLFVHTVAQLRDDWSGQLGEVAGQAKALKLSRDALNALPASPDFPAASEAMGIIAAADCPENWPRGTKGKFRDPLKSFFDEVAFLAALRPDDTHDPLVQDWEWAWQPMLALLQLEREFAAEFATRKREFGGVDFGDLEQHTLKLLRESRIASAWQSRLAHVFVDEYQDINAAQDAILTALSRAAGNRFLVGDVKQSIYRFRLANPHIFQAYESAWRAGDPSTGQALSLTENFRSRRAILDFVNPLFAALLRPELGGIAYEPLEFGAPENRAVLAATEPRVELHLIAKAEPEPASDAEDEAGEPNGAAEAPDLLAVEREARLIAQRFLELHRSGHEVWDKEQNTFRAVRWSDMAVLLRSPSGRAEAFAKEFHRLGIPLHAARDGFFASLEVSDLLNLLRLLDNPLQDVPIAAVLRSPLVGLSLDELVEIRLCERRDLLWDALIRVPHRGGNFPASVRAKAILFVEQFQRWRELARQTTLSQTLETALLDTHYESLLQAEPRGAERLANVRRLLDLARQFDPYQRQGLYRFLRFVRLQEDEELDLEPAAPATGEMVRLLSIHRSKGLEFPVVAVAGLGTRFNEQHLGAAVLLDETLGLSPKITPPGAEQSYPSLAHRRARQHEQRELRGEELRLLYVALTRTRDTLLLVGTPGQTVEQLRWNATPDATIAPNEILAARCHLDWLRLWLPYVTEPADWTEEFHGGNNLFTWRIVRETDEIFQLTPAPPTPLTTSPASAPVELTALRARLDWVYPHRSATQTTAKTSVTALRKRIADEANAEARPLFRFAAPALAPIAPADGTTRLSAAEIGIAHHTFLQHVTIARTETKLDLRNEAQSLRDAGVLAPEQLDALDFDALSKFWQSETGAALRQQPAAAINREMEFTARLTAADLKTLPSLAASAPLTGDDFIVVQGQVDLAVLLPEEIWLLDFKTDAVAEAGLPDKVKQYEPQLRVYAGALEKIYRRPVTRCWLHFLRAGKTVEL